MLSCQTPFAFADSNRNKDSEKIEPQEYVIIEVGDYFPFDEYENNPLYYCDENEITNEMMEEWLKFQQEEELHHERSHNPPPGFYCGWKEELEGLNQHKKRPDSPYPFRRRAISESNIYQPKRVTQNRRMSFSDQVSLVQSLQKDLYLFLLERLKGKERIEFLERIRNIKKATKMMDDEQKRRIQENAKFQVQEELQRVVATRRVIREIAQEKEHRQEQDYIEDQIFIQHYNEKIKQKMERELMYQHFMGRTIS